MPEALVPAHDETSKARPPQSGLVLSPTGASCQKIRGRVESDTGDVESPALRMIPTRDPRDRIVPRLGHGAEDLACRVFLDCCQETLSAGISSG